MLGAHKKPRSHCHGVCAMCCHVPTGGSKIYGLIAIFSTPSR